MAGLGMLVFMPELNSYTLQSGLISKSIKYCINRADIINSIVTFTYLSVKCPMSKLIAYRGNISEKSDL